MNPNDFRFGYGDPYSSVGAVATPFSMGTDGASSPINAYFQSPSTSGGFPSAPMGTSGINGLAFPGGVPGVGGNNAGIGGGSGFGFNANTLNLALGGLQTLGSIWSAWQANKLAKEQFDFTKKFSKANFANQVQSYNTALEDRIRSRTFTEGGTQDDAQQYIEDHKLNNRL